MQKPIALPLASSLAALFITAAASPLAMAGDSEHSFSGNMTLASQYIFRGIAQTRGKPALQGGIDYAHSSGFYAGLWGSNISWIGDSTTGASASIELDAYAGYGGAIGDSMSYDVGVLTYNYPGSGKNTGASAPDTTELYASLGYEWLTVKYSQSTGSLFGWTKTSDANAKTSGSGYLEVNGGWDLGDGWGVSAHVGKQKVKGNTNASYTDYRLGVSKELGAGSLELALTDTNAKADCNAGDSYCFVKAGDATSMYDAGKGALTASWSMSF